MHKIYLCCRPVSGSLLFQKKLESALLESNLRIKLASKIVLELFQLTDAKPWPVLTSALW